MHKYLQIIKLNPTFLKNELYPNFLQIKNTKLWKAVRKQSKNTKRIDSQPNKAISHNFHNFSPSNIFIDLHIWNAFFTLVHNFDNNFDK